MSIKEPSPDCVVTLEITQHISITLLLKGAPNMKKKVLSFILAFVIALTMLPGGVVKAYGNSSYSSNTPKAYSYLCDYAKNNGTYQSVLNSYTLRIDLQSGTWFELIYDATNKEIGMVISQYDGHPENTYKRGTLLLDEGYWNHADNWLDLGFFVSGYYLVEDFENGNIGIGDYVLLPKDFTCDREIEFNRGYSGPNDLKQTNAKEAALFVNDILTLTDAILRKGGYSVRDLGFVLYQGHTIHRYWGCHESLAPTCETAGYERDICYICGERLEQTKPALGHIWQLTETVNEGINGEHGTGKYACNRCGATKTAPLCALEVFTDAPEEGSWAHNAVDWAFFGGITTGTKANLFSPDRVCTREQVVTFLWRANGCPEPASTENPFTDVNETSYAFKAILWAVEKGITTGTSKTKFSPAQNCSRGQVVTFLWRAKGSPEPETEENPFKDVSEGDYFYKAVLWAVENNVTYGTSKTKFSPANTCTRAQVVTFLYRAAQLLDPEPAPDPDPEPNPDNP